MKLTEEKKIIIAIDPVNETGVAILEEGKAIISDCTYFSCCHSDCLKYIEDGDEIR